MRAEPCLDDARARLLHDLVARGADTAGGVSALDDVVSARAWWVGQWPQGRSFVAGQVAQDLQDRLLEAVGLRWPACRACEDGTAHELRVDPELGADPHWVCEQSGTVVAELGHLRRWDRVPE